MLVDLWLKKATTAFEKVGIGTARLDALVLLEDATGKDRAYLLAHPEINLTNNQLEKLAKQTEQRKKHVPLAQIRGKTEFYGREFIINKHVLEPRPESETMIDLLKSLKLPTSPVVTDIGTGSGAIGITAALEIPESEVVLTDIDLKCLRVAHQNTVKHAVDVEIMQADLLTNVSKADVVLSNLPYVPDSCEINRAAMNEPRIAIFGGQDGLDLYRKLFEQIATLKEKPLFVLTESLPFQHKKLAQIAKRARYKQSKEIDFIQVFAKD